MNTYEVYLPGYRKATSRIVQAESSFVARKAMADAFGNGCHFTDISAIRLWDTVATLEKESNQ